MINSEDLFKKARGLIDINPPDDEYLIEFIFKNQKKDKNQFYKFKRYIMPLSVLLVSLILLIYMMNNSNFSEKSIIKENKISQNQTNDTVIQTMSKDKKTIENNVNTEKNVRIFNNLRKSSIQTDKSNDIIIKADGKKIDFTDHGSIDTDTDGNPVPGIITIELTREELKSFGIFVNDEQLNWKMEYFAQIHPIPYRNNPNYRNKKEIEILAKADYPLNGDSLLVKMNYSINLNKKEDTSLFKFYTKNVSIYFGRNDSIRKNVFGKIGKQILGMQYYSLDTINGKEVYNLNEKIISAPDSGLLFMDINEYNKISEKMLNQGFSYQVERFTGWRKENYNESLPLITAFQYSVSGRKKEIHHSASPIYNIFKKQLDYSTLIPVSIKLKDKIIDKIVFWFYPTEEFIGNLPERYRSKLNLEVNLLSNLDDNNYENVCEKLQNESFFDNCRIKDGTVTFNSIYPNPTKDNIISIGFILVHPRTISISVHNTDGSFIGSIMKDRNFGTGNHNVKLGLDGINSGIYLITIQTNENEQVTKRLIINK